MRRYLYSNLLRIIFSSLLIIILIPSLTYFICSILIDKILNIASLIIIISCVILRLFLELVIYIYSTGKQAIVFFLKKKK